MSSTRIYQAREHALHELIEQACGQAGATLLIPDLQRPYVWNPQQVTLLVDSLIRGWPFGTLLLWSVPDRQIGTIPYRTFWSTVDRTKEDDGAQVPRREPPAEYRMVLDGQQRLQSLIVAVGSDSWGFKLLDREWSAALEQERPRGRATGHWSAGQLCVDLTAFALEYSRLNDDVESIDYRDVLRWVVRGVHDGLSKGATTNYNRPLAEAAKEPGRYVRLSRLWEIAKPRPELPKYYRNDVRQELVLHGLGEKAADDLVEPVAELVSVLGQVKAAPVTFLELRKFDSESFRSADRYNNAIVNIFTRLNTAGRVLTNQEIIFAWIKRNWLPDQTDGRNADECFRHLREQLVVRKLGLEMDDLVRGIAAVWSVLVHKGVVLGSRELLRGDIIEKMAPELAQRWRRLSDNIERCAELMQSLELEYGVHYESLNSMFLLWGWRFLAIEWLGSRSMTNMARDFLVKQVDDLFRASAERWILLSHWGGRWRTSAVTTFENYLKDLARTWADVQATGSADSVAALLSQRLSGWIDDLRPAAQKYVDDLSVDHRGEVHRYFVPLWVWHRLDAPRWEESRVQLRVGRKKVSLDVDHIISCKWWENNVDRVVEEESLAEDGEAAATKAGASGAPIVEGGTLNDIGNCFLLWTSFNISKSDRPLKSFLSQVYEFQDPARLQAWQTALEVAQEQIDPDAFDETTIRQAIAARTKAIKEELRKFINGAHLPAHDRPAFDVSGRWFAKTDLPGESNEQFDFELAQTGEGVLGSYGKDGRIQGELLGQWSEPTSSGSVWGRFDEDGRRFEGEWRYRYGRKSGGWHAERTGD
jgi:hypothetical protein